MRTLLTVVIGTIALSATARAQTPTGQSPAASKGYVEGVAQSAFGNVTSQSFGAELGVTVMPSLQVFVEAGQVRTAQSSDLGAGAQLIAGGLSQTQSNVGFQVREPVTFGLAGVRYMLPSSGRFEPYILGGAGAARVKKDVTFSLSGADVTSTLQQYGVVLGSDLSGSETKPMLTLGGGIAYPVWQRLVLDLQYRYGRVFASGHGINIHRAGAGIGVRF
jgi:opacity protein-like surface antigen